MPVTRWIQAVDSAPYKNWLLEYRGEVVGALVGGLVSVSFPTQIAKMCYRLFGISSPDAVAFASEAIAVTGRLMIATSLMYVLSLLGLVLLPHLQQMIEE